MKTVLYYSDASLPGERLSILSSNADGTLEIGIAAEGTEPVLRVGKCPVADTPKTGHCVIETDEAPVAKKSGKGK